MRWRDMRASEEAMIGWSTRSGVDEVLSECKTRFEDEVRSARRDAGAVRPCDWTSAEPGSRASANSGLLLGDDVTASKSIESSEEILSLARAKNAFVLERHGLR